MLLMVGGCVFGMVLAFLCLREEEEQSSIAYFLVILMSQTIALALLTPEADGKMPIMVLLAAVGTVLLRIIQRKMTS